MGLINCRECDKEISSEALKCPNCGCPTRATEEIIRRNKENNKKVFWGCMCILALLIIIVEGSIIYSKLTTPKANYDGFIKSMSYVVEQTKAIEDVVIKERNSFDVIVDNSWWNTTEEIKIKFCESMYNNIWVYAYDNDLIYKNKEAIFIYFVDQDGIEVATADPFGIEILY